MFTTFFTKVCLKKVTIGFIGAAIGSGNKLHHTNMKYPKTAWKSHVFAELNDTIAKGPQILTVA